MGMERPVFDREDEVAGVAADANAEEDIRAGRLISNDAVRRWLMSIVSGKSLPRPKIGD